MSNMAQEEHVFLLHFIIRENLEALRLVCMQCVKRDLNSLKNVGGLTVFATFAAVIRLCLV